MDFFNAQTMIKLSKNSPVMSFTPQRSQLAPLLITYVTFVIFFLITNYRIKLLRSFFIKFWSFGLPAITYTVTLSAHIWTLFYMQMIYLKCIRLSLLLGLCFYCKHLTFHRIINRRSASLFKFHWMFHQDFIYWFY